MENISKMERAKKLIFGVVLFLLASSIFYAAYMLFQAPGGTATIEGEQVKSDYILMLLQCVIGIVLMFTPRKVEKHFEIDIPNMLEIVYMLFLFSAFFLGNVWNFYFHFLYFDDFLHIFSGGMFSALGFVLLDILTGSEKKNVRLSPFFDSFFAFCFSMMGGVVWEIYEFLVDGLLGTNMQRFMNVQDEAFVGREALNDTMMDFIVSTIGALVVATMGYFYLRKKSVKESNT